MPRDRNNAAPIAHHDVFSLADDLETYFLERSNGALVRDTGNCHRLSPEDNFPFLSVTAEFISHGEVLVNGIADIVESLSFGLTLRGTAMKARHPHTEPFICVEQRNCVPQFSHRSEGAKPPRPQV